MFIYYHVHFHDDLSMHMGVRARNLKTKEKGKNLVLRKNDLETASFVEIFYTCFPHIHTKYMFEGLFYFGHFVTRSRSNTLLENEPYYWRVLGS